MSTLSDLEAHEVKEIFVHHLPYEIEMLSTTYEWLCQRSETGYRNSALIEAWAVHARNLVEFFEANEKKRLYTVDEYKRTNPFNGWLQIISNQISHLGKGRTAVDAKKIQPNEMTELTSLLRSEVVNFRGHLKPEYLRLIIKDIRDPRGTPAQTTTGAKLEKHFVGPTGTRSPTR